MNNKEEKLFEPFPEPRTIPENWDMSNFKHPRGVDHHDPSKPDALEKFPEPRTFPKNWNVSELIK